MRLALRIPQSESETLPLVLSLACITHEGRRESARMRVPCEAYLVSRMRRYRHTHSVLRFTFHERRFTRKRSGLALAIAAKRS